MSDGEGNFLAIATDSVEATLNADGNSWSGAYSATVADPNGDALFVGGGAVRATRIAVQPLTTPAAVTPVAQRDSPRDGVPSERCPCRGARGVSRPGPPSRLMGVGVL